jgi:hypothetical protein
MLDRITGFTKLTGCGALTYPSETTPTIFVEPTDRDVVGVDVAPPRFEICTRNIKRCRRYEVIEDDRVLFAPAEV